MLLLVPARAAHIAQITSQRAQASEVGIQGPRLPSPGWTAMAHGRPIACGGLVEMWTGRAYAWSLLDRDAGRHMVGLTRAIRSVLGRAAFRRIEMAVRTDFPSASRWAEMLGFERECLATAFFPDGADAYLYVRIKN